MVLWRVKHRRPQIQHQSIGPGENRDRVDQIQNLCIVQPLIAKREDVTGAQRRRLQGQVNGELHDGLFPISRGGSCQRAVQL